MPLHPHLHLLLPSSTPSIALEARIYLPSSPNDSSTTALTLLLNTAIRSHPIPLNQLTSGQKDELSGWGIGRIVTAAHPWGKLGGNQLDPSVSPKPHLTQPAGDTDLV